jgi:SAM-dependent methyltransferase
VHPSAMHSGKVFFDTYWQPAFRSVLDIGSMDVNGSLRTVAPSGARYIGVDILSGNGVDIVLRDAYTLPFPDETFDTIVSTSCFEHDEFFWVTFLEAARVLSDRGFFYLSAPSRTDFHHPPDRWRFYPDAGPALERWGHRNGVPIYLVESCLMTLENPEGDPVRSPHMDAIMIFSKQKDFVPDRYLSDLALGAEWVRKGSLGDILNRDKPFW